MPGGLAARAGWVAAGQGGEKRAGREPAQEVAAVEGGGGGGVGGHLVLVVAWLNHLFLAVAI